MTTIKIHNTETGEIIEREMNAQELAVWESDKAKSQAKTEAQAIKETAKAAAEAKLAALGLDADDLRALSL